VRTVDKQLALIAPSLAGDSESPTALGSGELLELTADPSILRITKLVAQSFSALPLAWLTPSDGEVLELVTHLTAFLTKHRASWGIISVLFASLCDLARRHRGNAALDALCKLGATNWLEHTALCRATNELVGSPALAQRMFPDWLPDLPPAVMRDPLTGMLSKSLLYQDPHRYTLPNGRVLSTRLPTRGAIIVNVDRMIRVNDSYGFAAGDAVLQSIAEQLHALVGDRAIRYGGDEQLVLWDERDGDIREVAEALVVSVRALRIYCVDVPNEPIKVTVSAGVAVGSDPTEVLHAAEDALIHAKAGGRDRISLNRD